MKKTDWRQFIRNYGVINEIYQEGKFETTVDIDKSGKFSRGSDSDTSRSYRAAAQKLFKIAHEAWENRSIPFEYFPKILRILILSEEIDNYFLVPDENGKEGFFLDFNYKFLEDVKDFPNEVDTSAITLFLSKIENIGRERISDLPDGFAQDQPAVLKLAKELLLMSLTGVAIKYYHHGTESYQEGALQVQDIFKLLRIYSHIKYKERANNSQFSTLEALAYFFKARFDFGRGLFDEAELAFKESTSIYLQRMNSLIPQGSGEKFNPLAPDFTLAMRRANLTQVIGTVNLYLAESRVEEALSTLKRIHPLLQINSGKVMISYTKLREIMARRAKFSSDLVELYKCERELRKECLRQFKTYLSSGNHFVAKTWIELSLIQYYKAEALQKPEHKAKLYRKSLENLNKAVDFSDGEPPKRRSILVEALPLRSRIYRQLAKLEGENFVDNIKLAIADAERAIKWSEGLDVLRSEAYVALGIAHYDDCVSWYNLVKEALATFEKLKRNEDKPKLTPRELDLKKKEAKVKIEKLQAEANQRRSLTTKIFFDSITANSSQNQRLLSVAYLYLSKLAMLNTTNFSQANYFFNKYKALRRVDHKYVKNLADGVEQSLTELAGLEFNVDPNYSLNFAYWTAELYAFLIRQTVFQAARENGFEKDFNKINVRNVLANAFQIKLGISQGPAYELAKTRLKEFENFWRIHTNQRKSGNPVIEYFNEQYQEIENAINYEREKNPYETGVDLNTELAATERRIKDLRSKRIKLNEILDLLKIDRSLVTGQRSKNKR